MRKNFEKYKGLTLFPRLHEMIAQLYPEHESDDPMFAPFSKRARQAHLRRVVADLFPDSPVVEEAPFGPQLDGGRPYTVDIFLPELRLGFEYQGLQHYTNVPVFIPALGRSQADSQKRQTFANAGITVIEVPYWWTLDLKKMKMEIAAQRPEFRDSMRTS